VKELKITEVSSVPCVATVPLFQGLSLEEQRSIAELAVPIHLAAGETIHRPGQDLSQLLVVHHGQVRVSQLTAQGQERVTRILGPGEFMGEAAFVSGSRPTTLATTLSEVQLCSFQHTVMQELVQQHPGIVLRMLDTVVERLASVEQLITDLTSSQVSARLARYVIELPTTNKNGVTRVTLPHAKKDVASLLGMTPETFSRQLNRFTEDGLIRVQGHTIEVLQPAQLIEVAEG
jgi:CRP-like cAMP-binding protein